jgi:tetraacyldisaccharide 4'-kinase
LSLARRLQDMGHSVSFLSRGHGGRLAGPVQVDPSTHDARDVGDEALLLAEVARAWVSRNRGQGGIAAEQAGAGVIIMDDGFQNPGLEKSLSLVVADGAYGFGNGRVLPAGPLREPIDQGLARADALVLIGEDRTDIAASLPDDLPVLRAEIRLEDHEHLPAGTSVLGFAGIGRPAKFHASLEESGLNVVGFEAFADHHVHTASEIDALLGRAKALNAALVTTAKDHVKLPESTRGQILRLNISLAWQDEAALSAILEKGLRRGPG